jgi:DNA-3-methyladenine glycosylase I
MCMIFYPCICIMSHKTLSRCPWAPENKLFYRDYHDHEWGVPVHDDRDHFEMLILEGAQAGLSWETILKRRADYRRVFMNFDPVRVARMTDSDLEKCLTDPGIIRNRLKVYGTRKNAHVFLDIQKEYGTFDSYVWSFTGGKPIQNKWQSMADVPTWAPVSDALSKDLKKRGMTFVGTTIIYAYMQAIGMVNDHLTSCFRHTDLSI